MLSDKAQIRGERSFGFWPKNAILSVAKDESSLINSTIYGIIGHFMKWAELAHDGKFGQCREVDIRFRIRILALPGETLGETLEE